jgi:hypothetical protein
MKKSYLWKRLKKDDHRKSMAHSSLLMKLQLGGHLRICWNCGLCFKSLEVFFISFSNRLEIHISFVMRFTTTRI